MVQSGVARRRAVLPWVKEPVDPPLCRCVPKSHHGGMQETGVSQAPRTTLRKGIHAVQEVLEVGCAANDKEAGCRRGTNVGTNEMSEFARSTLGFFDGC
jgi:hypothetical protein